MPSQYKAIIVPSYAIEAHRNVKRIHEIAHRHETNHHNQDHKSVAATLTAETVRNSLLH